MGCSSSSTVAPLPHTTTSKDATFFESFDLAAKLGKGSFAQVRLASSKTGGEQIAVKIMDLRCNDSERINGKLAQEAREEAAAWRAVGEHDNIVALRDVYFEHGAVFFLMDVCETNLLRFLESGAGASDIQERSLGRVLAAGLRGLAHVHSRGVVHRDVKPDNFMVSKGIVKLCDFGLAGMGLLQGTYGTAPYMAPEMLLGKKYGAAVDVWALGAMAYVLIFGAFPYLPKERNAMEMKKCIREGKRLPSFKPLVWQRGGQAPELSKEAVKFVRSLLQRAPHQRPSAEEALQSEYLLVCETMTAGEDALPSMRPMLVSAVKSGAFEHRRLDSNDGDLDPLLRRLSRQFSEHPCDSGRTRKVHVGTKLDSAPVGSGRSSPSAASTHLSSVGSTGATLSLPSALTD